MNIRNNSRTAFTLIEMLMVVIIIFMLSLLVFRLMKMVEKRSQVAETVYVLKQVQNALNEYKLEYGIYPPVNFVEYEYESATNQTMFFRTWLGQRNDVNDPTGGGNALLCFWSDMPGRTLGSLGWSASPYYPSLWNMGCRYGLVAHLDFRDRGQPHWYDFDTERDKEAKAKWAPFMDNENHKLVGFFCFSSPYDVSTQVGTTCVYSNKIDTILDGFGQPIEYECNPPYSSYRLWSVSGGTIDSGMVGGVGGVGGFSN